MAAANATITTVDESNSNRFSTSRSSKTRTLRNNGGQYHHYTVNTQIPPPHLHSQYEQQQPSLLFQQQPSDGPSLQQNLEPVILNTFSGDFGQFISEHGSTNGPTEMKWSRHDICTPCNCICFFLAFIFLLTALMSGIYYGLNFFDGKQLKERVFKAQFVVRNQDFLSNDLENADSNEFHIFSDMLKKKINSLFQQSMISNSYVKTEIIAFERKRNSHSEVIIHLNIHVAANKQPSVEASDIYLVLADEIINNRLKVFDNLMVDHNSIDVQERRWIPKEKASLTSNPWTYKSMFPGMLEGLSTEPTPAPRKCGRIDLAYCHFLSYNQTSYPNFFNHWNVSSIEDEFIMYKELIDSECYSLSKEFLCNLLQPECIADDMILPCQEFCFEFYNSCRKWLPEKLTRKLSCYSFPTKEQQSYNYNNNGKRQCRDKPNCATILRLQSQHHKLCDGIFDCADQTDELSCSYCDLSEHFHCGDKQCIAMNLTCDNIKDCHNGADEMNCLRLGATSFPDSSRNDQTKMAKMTIANEGYLVAILKGKHSFVCSDHSSIYNYSQHNTYYDNQTPMLGHNICNENHFEKLIQIETKPATVSGPFTRFVPGTTLPSPYPIQCKSKQVYYMKCSGLKCGVNHIPADSLTSSKSRKSWPGYWPWYAKVNINGHYYCDGTLISMDTIMAQTTCFTNQRSLINNHNNNLTVTLGSIRLSQDNIEAVEYSVESVKTQQIHDGDVKLTLLKLDMPIKTSSPQIIRPICQKGDGITWTSSHKCVVLHLNYELDILQHRPVKIVNMERCKQQQQQQQLLFNSTKSILDPSNPLSASQQQQQQPSTITTTTTSSKTSSLMMAQPPNYYNNKLCVVEWHNNESPLPLNYYYDDDTLMIGPNHNNNGTCKNCLPTNNNNNTPPSPGHTTTSLGRHLYCLVKNQWNLLAIEHQRLIVSRRRKLSSYNSRKSSFDPNNNNMDDDDDDENKTLILFQIIPK